MTVRTSASRLDAWDAIPGETRWVDYSCDRAGDDLVVYLHAFRRIRERFDLTSDVLLWKPSTTKVARRYAAAEWDAVVRFEREWPPMEMEKVARRPRRSPAR